MNCAAWEQLIDAYLDGGLSNSLRLEFDVHRLRCRRCQLTLAMMESVGHVLAADSSTPALSDDFTDRVTVAIERQRPVSVRLRSTRVAVAAGALLQAAAVLYLAIWLPSRVPPPAPSSDNPDLVRQLENDARLTMVLNEADAKFARHQTMVDFIYDKLTAAGMNFAAETNQLAGYAVALSVPEDLARDSADLLGASPLDLIIRVLVPAQRNSVATPAAGGSQEL